MKIIIHSLDELLALASLIDPRARVREVRVDSKIEMDAVPQFDSAAFMRRHTPADVLAPLRSKEAAVVDALEASGIIDAGAAMERRMALAAQTAAEPNGLPTDIAQPEVLTGEARLAAHEAAAADSAPPSDAGDEWPARDADGAPYSTDWHSDPKKLTAKNVWRAKRGRDEDAYKAWLLEQAKAVAEAAIAADADPVATETHALPQDEQDCGLRDAVERDAQESAVDSDNRDESRVAAPAVDLQALVAASQKAAEDASDSHVDLLNVCRDFTTKRGHAAFAALKAAVAPDGDTGQGKAVQQLTPGERRLLQACIANYPV